MKQMYRLLVGLFALSMLAAGCYSEDSYQPSGTTLDVGAAPVADGTNRGLVQEGDSAPPPIATAVPAPAADESPEEGESDAEPETDEAASADGNCASAEFLCVGLVTDAGGQIDDNGFNQSAWEGVQSSVADQVDFVQTNDASEFEPNIQGFLDQDYDMVITVGFGLAETTQRMAIDNPDTLFVGVDQFQGETIDNLAGLVFAEDKAGFMAGALAGLLTESDVVSAVMASDIPPVVAFAEGFAAGAAYTNPDVEVISTYHPGAVADSFRDAEWGALTARVALEANADVIFAAGGETGNGALIEVAGEGDGSFCIGVDADQWLTVPEAHPCLVTSAMKLIDSGVSDLVGLGDRGSFPGGNFAGEVGLAPFHDFVQLIDGDVQDEMQVIIPQVLAGALPTR